MGEITVFELPLEAWVMMWLAASVLLFILWISAVVRIGKLKRRLNGFVKDTGVPDLEGVIAKLHGQTDHVQGALRAQGVRLDELENKTGRMKANVGIIRYNAFADRGSDLSFSLAIVDDRLNGVVVTTLHSRDESLVYAKPLEAGTSSYALTPEEKEAITQSLRKK